jgi:nucleotide-binding universal stress UspA family protein
VALREGALLAKRCQAKVFILSVVPDGGGVRLAEGVYAGAIPRQMENYEAVLERGVTRLRALGLEPTKRLAVGDPVRIIAAFAREAKVDLVVVGHHRKNMLGRWWSGSSGSYISDHVGCSILIARKQISDEVIEAEMALTAKSA